MYNEMVLDHFVNPRNARAMDDADGIGQTGNPADGDKIKIFIKVRDERLERVQFQTFGCAAAIAASSMLTVLSTGKTLDEAMALTNGVVAEALGGLPEKKMTCSNIAAFALHEAIDHYRKKNAEPEYEAPTGDSCDFGYLGLDAAQRVNLSPDQAQRYLRQIIIPEIQGLGQKKLLDAHVRIVSEDIDSVALMIFYLAAMGIGRIACSISGHPPRVEQVLAHARDINPDLTITRKDQEGAVDLTVFFNSLSESNEATSLEQQNGSHELHVVTGNWRGLVTDHATTYDVKKSYTGISSRAGKAVASAFAGSLVAIEVAKRFIGIGDRVPSPFFFDLWHMTFGEELIPTPAEQYPMTNDELDNKRVLIVGTGGLGTPSAFILSAAGIGTLGLVDDDRVELSNLNRQILHTTSRIGRPKVSSAAQALETFFPELCVYQHETLFNRKKAPDLLKEYDLVVDGLDNVETRLSVNDATREKGVPFVHAGVLSFYGQASTFQAKTGPCYRCLFPQQENTSAIPNCAETGVLGPVPGLMAAIQSAETIKLLLSKEAGLKGKLLTADLLEGDLQIFTLSADVICRCASG